MVKDFRKYEKLEYKKNKLKSDIDFLNNCKQLGVYPKFLIFKLPNVSNSKNSIIANNLVCIRNSLSLNCRMFLIKTLYQFVKDSFIVPSMSVTKNFNIFQKISVYLKTFYLNSFLLLSSTFLQNL